MYADLHLHTNFSDGTYTPEELAFHAKSHDLSAIALTDHDTVAGCERMSKACETQGLEFIPGAELTAEIHGIEFHLLAYCIDIHHPELLTETQKYQGVRQNRVREMVARLNQLNIPITERSVFELANCDAPGRPHVARALVQEGYCENLDEAFERFLKKRRPAWVPKSRMSAHDAIQLIHRAGGVAVLAHPGLNNVDDAIPEMASSGLDGIECFYTKHSTSTTEHYLQIADTLNLIVTGGSDCHGMNKGQPLIGSIKLPYDFVERLKATAAKWSSAQFQPPSQ